MEPEKEDGNVEYKLKLLNITEERIESLACQMRYRCDQGAGECIYNIGVRDNGELVGITKEEYEQTLKILVDIAEKNTYKVSLISTTIVDNDRNIYEVLVRENNINKYIDIKVAVAGNVDAGKCLGYGTLVHMYPYGMKEVQNIVKDDLVMGDDNLPRKVLETSDGFGNMYKIVPENGRPFSINKNHVLCMKANNCNYIYKDNKKHSWCVKILINQNNKPTIIVKYFKYINNSYILYSRKQAEIYFQKQLSHKNTIKRGDIVELTLENYINLGLTVKSLLKLYHVGINYPRQSTNIDPYYFGYCLGSKKYNPVDRIPKYFKYNTICVRLLLLEGLISSNNDNEEDTFTINYLCRNILLIEDIVELCRSLGFCVYFTISNTYVTFRIDRNSKSREKRIKSVELLGKHPYYGFQIDGNGRFLLSDYTVTHNSTFLSVLTYGKLDNGKGSSRLSVFNYPHELKTGRTSSIAHQILGFDSDGNCINYIDNNGHHRSWPELVRLSRKVISFYDTAGHEKYLKTTILGLSSSQPDLCMIIVSANKGIRHDQNNSGKQKRYENMTREHIFLCITLNIPFVIIVSKIDMIEEQGIENIYEQTIKDIQTLIRCPGIRRQPIKVENKDDILICSKQVHTQSIVPIFPISNVTGKGINEVKTFLNLMTKTNKQSPSGYVQYHIDSTWSVVGFGTVIGGHLINGTIKINDKLFLGPNNGRYDQVIIRSIHCKRVPVQIVGCGSYVCLGLKKIERKQVRRGNVIVSDISQHILTNTFIADIKVLKSHSTTIKVGYEPVIHVSSIRQSATLIKIDNKINFRNPEQTQNDDILRTDDTATCTFRFKFQPEYIIPDMRLLMAEGRTKIIGIVKSVNN